LAARFVNTAIGLHRFRTENDGARILELLAENNGHMAVTWPVGIGKSHNLDQAIRYAINGDNYDFVIVLAPTWLLINERGWVVNPPDDISVVVLRRRPGDLCGPTKDKQWEPLERNSLGAVGRQQICSSCKHLEDCTWHDQLSNRLNGVQVVFTTQAHLEINPGFLDLIVKLVDAKNPLVIFDESNTAMRSYKIKFSSSDLQKFLSAIETCTLTPNVREWMDVCQILLDCRTIDLIEGNWRLPWLSSDTAAEIQNSGYTRFGATYKYIGYTLGLIGRSLPASRHRASNGDISFSVRPSIPCDVLIYSSIVSSKLLEYRFGRYLASPFSKFRFAHPDTRWYNIASRTGALKNFPGNAAQILDFFAELIVERLSRGKRVLLIAKKRLVPFCDKYLNQRLAALGRSDHRVLSEFNAGNPDHSKSIPLINFGIVGTNLFEDFDCCYCLSGFYISEAALNNVLQDLIAEEKNIPLELSITNPPRRRTVRVKNKMDQHTDIQQMAQEALNYLEMGTVVQAVGRVRPYTSPREIITFQCAEHPDSDYTVEFSNLGEARQYFSLPSRRERNKNSRYSSVQELKAKGLKQTRVASELCVSRRTVQRHWKAS